MASGALASGLGYAIWYAALPHLSRTRARGRAMSVPVIAGFGAVVFIGEALTPRLLIASAVILGGIAVVLSLWPDGVALPDLSCRSRMPV
ncbi:MAG: hypothetical protein NVV62_16705 [Terricaulis sp.]|nr:hypothetical protein [Terricaulis sp.]